MPQCKPGQERISANGKAKLSVWGSNYPFVSGMDLKEYYEYNLDNIDGAVSYKTVGDNYLGTGQGYSVLEVIQTFEKATGQKINYKVAPRRAGDIAECYADPTKAKKELHWAANQDLYEMCADSWKFTIQIHSIT